jgi:hypothetical protein
LSQLVNKLATSLFRRCLVDKLLEVGTALSQLVNKLATNLLRSNPVDKLLEQHCHNLLTSLPQTYCKQILLTSCWNSMVTIQRCNLTLARMPGASECHDGQVNVLSCLPDWASYHKRYVHLDIQICDKEIEILTLEIFRFEFSISHIPICSQVSVIVHYCKIH